MTKEQEEVIENVKELAKILDKTCKNGKSKNSEDIRIILNLTQEQQAELKKKDKIITDLKQKVLNENYARNKAEDKYAELINKFSPIYDIKIQAELEKKDKIINNAINAIEDLIQYFGDNLQQADLVLILEILKDSKVTDW